MLDDHRHPLKNPWPFVWAVIGVPWVMLSLLGLGYHLNPWNPTLGDLSQDWLSAKCYFAEMHVYTSLDESMPKFLGASNDGAEALPINGHPPTSILLVLPLGQFEYPVAKLAWQLVSLACVTLAVAGIAGRRGLALDASNYWPLGVLVLCSGPLASETLKLQFNGVLLLLLTAAWLAQRHGWSWLAGAMIGVAASIKLFPLYLLFVFAAMRDWRAVMGGVVAFATLVGASLAVFGIDAWQAFLLEVMPLLATWRGAWLNSSLMGFWSRLFDPGNPFSQPIVHWPLAARMVVLLCAALLSAGILWQSRRATGMHQRDRVFGAGVVAMILCSPTAWDHYWLMLVLPLAIWWYTARVTPISRIIFWLCVFLLGVIRPGWTWNLVGGTASPLQTLTILAYPCYCLLALYGLLVFGAEGKSAAESRLRI